MNKLTGTILTLPKMSGNVGAKTINIGGKGDDGATFTPSVSADGIISWTNDKDLPNPEPVNIKGTKGDKGDRGEQGIQGIQGAKGETGAQGQKGADGTPTTHRWSGTTLYITSASGTSSADLKGEKGDRGEKGDKGADGTMTFEDLTAEQKASLKGDKGDKGDPGTNGKDGYTPVKGVDYFDGKDGQNGSPGKDGTSVTVKSVTESNADDGSNVVTFSDGKTLTVKNGSRGRNGYTPTKGIDYDDGVGIDYFKQTVQSDVDGGTNRFDLLLTNGHPETFYIKNGTKGTPGLKGDAGKTAYEYAKDGGYTGTEAQFAAKLATEFPTKLPNPNALTIDGKSYDGSAPVAVEFPNKLPNPKALTVDGKTYDGSEPVDVQLPTKLPNPNALLINGKRYDGSETVSMNIEETVASNWLAKSGQPGHILFRPCYEAPEVTLADNVEVTSGYYNWINYKAVADYEKVTVVYDGTTYICPITFQESHSPELGDESFFYIGNLNGYAPEYPFSIVGYRNIDISSIVVGDGTHTLSVKLEAFVKKIDAKFLPNDDDGEVVDWDIVPKDSYTMDGEYARHTFDNVTPLVTGKTYIATVDGVECERVAKYNAEFDLVYIGNGFIFTDDPADKNEDVFCYWTWSEGKGAIYMVVEDYASKTVVFGVREKKESGSSGGVSSWNDLTDKPFYPVIITPVFDGDMTGRETVFVQEGTYAVKVSSQSVSVSDMIGATATVNMGGTEQTIPLTAENAVDATNALGVPGAVVLQGTDPIAISLPEDAVIQGMSLSAGTWFMCMVGQFHVKSLSCLAETVEKINPSCLPDGYPYVETIMVDPTFDGDITGREYFMFSEGTCFVKVTSQYVSIAEAVGATMVMNVGGEEQTVQLTADYVMDASLAFGIPGTMVGDGQVLSFPEDVAIEGVTITAGTWFMCIVGQFHVKSLSCLAESVEIITKIDRKFLPPIEEDALPESVMTEDEYNARRTHWTDDNGTVHQLDKKYIPGEWLAVEALTNVTFMPETTVTMKEGTSQSTKPFYANWQPLRTYPDNMAKKAEAVIINFDGTRYSYDGGHDSYGNSHIANSSKEDTGEPFIIMFIGGNGNLVRIIVNDTEPTEHTISIEMQGVMLPVRMPEEYLPESVDGVVIRSSTANSTKKFRITVDDNGTLAATEVT